MRSSTRAAGLLVALSLALAPGARAETAGPSPASPDAAPALRAGVFSPPRDAPDFTLQGSNGGPLTLARYRGKVVILQFGFSSCPEVCPTTLRTMAEVHRRLGDKAEQVQLLYITVDPEQDDVEKLKGYLAFFDKRFVGGTGTDAELAAVRKAYGIMAERLTAGDQGRFSHSSFTYLVDRGGKLRALMPYGSSADDYLHDLEILLKEAPGNAR